MIYVDGGARGNPGPAGAGVVIQDSGGKTLFAGGYFMGHATNNVAEYTGLLRGLEQAQALGAKSVRAFSDSELMVSQINGVYRVKNAGLKPLFEKATGLIGRFAKFQITHVRREKNKQADLLVNQAVDARRNVGDAAR